MLVLPACNLKDLHVLYHSEPRAECDTSRWLCDQLVNPSPKRTFCVFYLEPDLLYQMSEVLCERRLASQQRRQLRCSETGPLQTLTVRRTMHVLIANTRHSALHLRTD
jgi:hypothetical protein